MIIKKKHRGKGYDGGWMDKKSDSIFNLLCLQGLH